MPVVMAADWLIDPPSEALSFRQAAAWLIYPLAWLGYTMLRGSLVGWYPYPFLNPDAVGGYGAVLLYILLILVGALFFIWLLVWLGRKARQWVSKSSAADYVD
jgi:uncharacterized membrane protein